MGATQSIPVVGEVVTVIDSGVRTVAAGACAAVGKTEAAGKLIDSAGQSWKDYSEKSAIASNIQILANLDDKERVSHLLSKQGEAWKSLGENTPVVGHVVGAAYYITGDTDGGNRCMIGATRTAVIATATIATGGGALAAGGIAVGAAAVYDGVATGIHSARYGEFRPVGYIDAVSTAVKTGEPTDILNAVMAPVSDFATGALIARTGVNPAGRIATEGTTAAGLLAEVPRGRPAMWALKEEVPGGTVQAPHSIVVASGRMKTSASTSGALQHLENGAAGGEPQVYDFVRRANGEYRLISHEDARAIAQRHGVRVGHTSLVEHNTPVVAAGEIYVDGKGNITAINSLSGHFRLKLSQIREAMGPTWPQTRFSNLLRPRVLFGKMIEHITPLIRLRNITSYTCILTNDISIGVGAAKYAVAVHTDGHVETALLQDESLARQLYQKADAYPSRILASVSDGNLTNVMEKTSGPESDQIESYLKNSEREEPVADENGHLDAAQFLPLMDGDSEEVLKFVPKTDGRKRIGRVSIIANGKEIIIPVEMKWAQEYGFLAWGFWEGKFLEKTHFVQSPELLVNERNMHWVNVNDVNSNPQAHLAVDIGYDGANQRPIYAVSRPKQGDDREPLVGYWMRGESQACLFGAQPKSTDKFDVLCWNLGA